MFNAPSLRYRYTQFFVLFLLCSALYVMTQSIGSGVTNFQDNLYKKGFLIESVTRLRIKIGDEVFPQALLGKDGWMHYTGDGELNYFQNVRKMENEKVLVEKLTALNQYLKSQGITLLLVVAPDKSTIYPDTLPGQIKPLSTQSWLDSLISYSGDNNLPIIVDLRTALLAARQKHDVFFKTDTHWNGYGAFAAYTTIINVLKDLYPELKPYKVSDLKRMTTNPEIRDIPTIMGVNTIKELGIFFAPKKSFFQTLHPGDIFGYDQISWIPDSKLPTLLMFHDSQGIHYLNDYLSMNFGKSYFVHCSSMAQYLTQESIQKFKPDVIIIEIVERGLSNIVSTLINFSSE
jgi:hypothetical protein